MMNKTVVLVLILFTILSVGLFKSWRAGKEIDRLNNQLAVAEKMKQETKSAYSAKSQEVSDLTVGNKELQKIISKRDEQIAVLASTTLKLKDQIFKIKNAKETVVDKDGNPVGDVSCPVSDQRIRVDFQKEQGVWNVEGFCLTNPASAEVSISWLRPLELSFVLTKKSGQYRLYLDSGSPDIIAVKNLGVKIDPSVFEKKWYQKLALGLDLGLGGKDPLISVRSTFDIQNFAVGPVMTLYNGPEGLQKAFGISLGWRMFDSN